MQKEDKNIKTINVNLQNLTEEEKNQLLKLIEKSNKNNNSFKVGDEYYYLTEGGIIYSDIWENHDVDFDKLAINNAFKTEKLAEFEKEKRKVEKELQDFADTHNESKIDWDDEDQAKYFIYFNFCLHELVCMDTYFIKHKDIYFTSKAIAKQAIKQIGEERIKKYYLGVEKG